MPPKGEKKNIIWKGHLNKSLARILCDKHKDYHSPGGKKKIDYCREWAHELGIGDRDRDGQKTKQHIDGMLSEFKAAMNRSMSTGFGDKEVGGVIITAKEQLVKICEVWDILYPALAQRRTSKAISGLDEDGLMGTGLMGTGPGSEPTDSEDISSGVTVQANSGPGDGMAPGFIGAPSQIAIDDDEEDEEIVSPYAHRRTTGSRSWDVSSCYSRSLLYATSPRFCFSNLMTSLPQF
jgi:hypothetical protein